MSKIQEQFEHPTANLDQTKVLQTLSDLPSLKENAAAFRAAGYVTTGVDRGSDSETASNSRLDVQGSLHVTARCPGELDVPSFGTNGTFELTLGVQKNLIKRGIGGVATDCVLRGYVLGYPVKVTLDGPISFDLGRDLGLRQRWSGRLLMHVGGVVSVDGYEFTNVTARWTNEQLEYLFTLPDDTWVVGILTEQGSISIRDRNVTWGCSDGQTCATL